MTKLDENSMKSNADGDYPRVQPSHEKARSVPGLVEDNPYSIFTTGEKWTIVVIASVAGCFR